MVVCNQGMRTCNTCHHLNRPDIDRRLAVGEPVARVAQAYGLTQSSVYRHRINCLKFASSNAITKEAARGTAAMALLPSKETLGGAYFELRDRIDQIARQAEQQGSLKVALSGLNSIRQTLDSLARLAGHDGAKVNVAVQTSARVDVSQVVERLIAHFDHEPDIKARIAQALLDLDTERGGNDCSSADHERDQRPNRTSAAPARSGEQGAAPPPTDAGRSAHQRVPAVSTGHARSADEAASAGAVGGRA
jgi:hypothetical protein